MTENCDTSDRWICYKVFDQSELTGSQPEMEIVKEMENYSTIVSQSDGRMPNILWDNVRIENVKFIKKIYVNFS